MPSGMACTVFWFILITSLGNKKRGVVVALTIVRAIHVCLGGQVVRAESPEWLRSIANADSDEVSES